MGLPYRKVIKKVKGLPYEEARLFSKLKNEFQINTWIGINVFPQWDQKDNLSFGDCLAYMWFVHLNGLVDLKRKHNSIIKNSNK